MDHDHQSRINAVVSMYVRERSCGCVVVILGPFACALAEFTFTCYFKFSTPQHSHRADSTVHKSSELRTSIYQHRYKHTISWTHRQFSTVILGHNGVRRYLRAFTPLQTEVNMRLERMTRLHTLSISLSSCKFQSVRIYYHTTHCHITFDSPQLHHVRLQAATAKRCRQARAHEPHRKARLHRVRNAHHKRASNHHAARRRRRASPRDGKDTKAPPRSRLQRISKPNPHQRRLGRRHGEFPSPSPWSQLPPGR